MANQSIEMVCVSGANHTNPFALVLLNENLRPQMADPAVRKTVEAELNTLREQVNHAVDPHEKLAFIAVITDEWSIENSFLTPTLKLKRNVVEAAYEGQVEGWYAERKPVVWH
jgi:long-subunit acyl-CoA synthetase (AMP-forming)